MTSTHFPAPSVETAERLLQLAAALPDPDRDLASVLGEAIACVQPAVPEDTSLSVMRGASRTRPAATLAASDDHARLFDAWQLELDEGPALDALVTGATIARPLDADAPWPRLVERVRERAAARSVLCQPLRAGDTATAVVVMTRPEPEGFDAAATLAATWAAAGLGLVLAGLDQRERARNLDVALTSSRRIGAAVGIVMARRAVTYDAAFEALRRASQREQRKLRDIADEVVLTGTLAEPEDASAAQA